MELHGEDGMADVDCFWSEKYVKRLRTIPSITLNEKMEVFCLYRCAPASHGSISFNGLFKSWKRKKEKEQFPLSYGDFFFIIQEITW